MVLWKVLNIIRSKESRQKQDVNSLDKRKATHQMTGR